jgi:hypothetical protein
MSDFLGAEYGDADAEAAADTDADGIGTRRHALWGLAVLVGVAAAVVGLMVLFGVGSSGGGNNNAIVPPPLPTGSATPGQTAGATTSPASPTSAAASTSSSPTDTASSSTPATVRSGNPCTGAATCVVDGDGGAVAAVNAYRAQHHLPPVPGTVTANAQTCALHSGGGATCVPHYAWTSMRTQDGTAAITKIASFAGPWLLDAKMSSFSVGWAYAGGSYQCVLLKTP